MNYTQEVYPTILTALESITAQQANPTEHTMQKVKKLLDYASTHPDAKLTYHASAMVLVGHSNASYLSEARSKSRTGGHFSCQTTRRSLSTMDQC